MSCGYGPASVAECPGSAASGLSGEHASKGSFATYSDSTASMDDMVEYLSGI